MKGPQRPRTDHAAGGGPLCELEDQRTDALWLMAGVASPRSIGLIVDAFNRWRERRRQRRLKLPTASIKTTFGQRIGALWRRIIRGASHSKAIWQYDHDRDDGSHFSDPDCHCISCRCICEKCEKHRRYEYLD